MKFKSLSGTSFDLYFAYEEYRTNDSNSPAEQIISPVESTEIIYGILHISTASYLFEDPWKLLAQMTLYSAVKLPYKLSGLPNILLIGGNYWCPGLSVCGKLLNRQACTVPLDC